MKRSDGWNCASDFCGVSKARAVPFNRARFLAPEQRGSGLGKRRGAGYTKPVNYAGHAVHVQSNKSVRVMRGAIPGAKPLVSNDDIFSADGIKSWNAGRRGL